MLPELVDRVRRNLVIRTRVATAADEIVRVLDHCCDVPGIGAFRLPLTRTAVRVGFGAAGQRKEGEREEEVACAHWTMNPAWPPIWVAGADDPEATWRSLTMRSRSD